MRFDKHATMRKRLEAGLVDIGLTLGPQVNLTEYVAMLQRLQQKGLLSKLMQAFFDSEAQRHAEQQQQQQQQQQSQLDSATPCTPRHSSQRTPSVTQPRPARKPAPQHSQEGGHMQPSDSQVQVRPANQSGCPTLDTSAYAMTLLSSACNLRQLISTSMLGGSCLHPAGLAGQLSLPALQNGGTAVLPCGRVSMDVAEKFAAAVELYLTISWQLPWFLLAVSSGARHVQNPLISGKQQHCASSCCVT